MTKSDTDPNFPPVPQDTVPPVAKGEDLSGFKGPVPLVVKAQSNESAGREAAEYHGEHVPGPRVAHNTIPNQRVLVEKTPVPPKAKVDPPGMTTDPGGRGEESPWVKRRGPLIALAIFFIFVAGAVFTKLVVRDPGPPVPTTTTTGVATSTAPTTSVPVEPTAPTVTTSATQPLPTTTASTTLATSTSTHSAPTVSAPPSTTASAQPPSSATASSSSSGHSIFTHP